MRYAEKRYRGWDPGLVIRAIGSMLGPRDNSTQEKLSATSPLAGRNWYKTLIKWLLERSWRTACARELLL
eukprot:3586092-Prymnesium_polylepis.1